MGDRSRDHGGTTTQDLPGVDPAAVGHEDFDAVPRLAGAAAADQAAADRRGAILEIGAPVLSPEDVAAMVAAREDLAARQAAADESARFGQLELD